MDFRTESVSELADQVRKGDRSARDLVTHALERIETDNPRVNAFVAVDGERALAAAAAIDRAGGRGLSTRDRWPGSRSGSRTSMTRRGS